MLNPNTFVCPRLLSISVEKSSDRAGELKLEASTLKQQGHVMESLYRRLQVFRLSVWYVLLLRILNLTLRYQYFRRDHRLAAEACHPSGSFCTALWHQNTVASMLAHSNLGIRAMTRTDPKGEILVKVLSAFGFGSIRGEAAGGGRTALQEIYRRVPTGCKVAITVDGPHGPRHEVKSGIVAVAATKGIPILPVAAVADRYWELRSWDKLRIPKPFSKVRIMYGAPIHLPHGDQVADFEKAKIQLSQALHRIERQMARFRKY